MQTGQKAGGDRIEMENYHLLRPLGSGGTSSVYLGVDKKSGERYAVKKYEWEAAFRSAEKEIQLLEKLDHPAIPKFRELVCESEICYVVMDYVPGITMKEHIRREIRIPEENVIRWGEELCDILSYLHSRYPPVIFCDLKPANLILSPLSQLRMIDFGAAVEVSPGKRNPGEKPEPYELTGTPGYAAPEQFRSEGEIDERTDIYALGATLYHMLTGEIWCCQKKWQLPKKCSGKVSDPMKKVVEKCLKEEPGERYRFCEEIREELKDIKKRVWKETLRLCVTRSELL